MPHISHGFQLPRGPVAALLGAATLLLPAIAAAPASATGAYPGETLSVAQSNPAVVGQIVNFVASGQQTDVESDPGGFDLNVFEKPQAIDPTCAPEYDGENNTWGSDLANEFHPVVGLWQGPGQSFSVPFKIVPDRAGPMLVCAYSVWSFGDTAAVAPPLTVEVAAAAGSAPAPAPGNSAPTVNSAPNPGPTARPADTTKPHVTRSGKKLTCNPGTWSGNPTGYAYGWLLNGHRQNGAHSRTLAVSHKLRGHKVQCSVTASNAGGQVTAVSSPFPVH